MRLLYEQPERLEFVVSYRQVDVSEFSCHITFNAQIPLKYQRQLSTEIAKLLNIDVDNSIYFLNKSLRVPGCIKIHKGVIIPDSALLCEEQSFESCFTVRSKWN